MVPGIFPAWKWKVFTVDDRRLGSSPNLLPINGAGCSHDILITFIPGIQTTVKVGPGVSAADRQVTYTIHVGNDSSEKTWEDVVLADVLDGCLW